VYEEEGKHFFHDLSDVVIEDDVLTRLTTFPTVIVTPHQGKTLLMRKKEALALGCHRALPRPLPRSAKTKVEFCSASHLFSFMFVLCVW
jgi:hypothetical protein